MSTTSTSRSGLLATALKASFAIALCASVTLGVVLVLTQLVALLIGAGGTVSGISAALAPIACICAAWACVSSQLVGYVSEQPKTED